MCQMKLRLDLTGAAIALKVATLRAQNVLEAYNTVVNNASDAAYALIVELEKISCKMDEEGKDTTKINEEITNLYKLVKDHPDDKVTVPDFPDMGDHDKFQLPYYEQNLWIPDGGSKQPGEH